MCWILILSVFASIHLANGACNPLSSSDLNGEIKYQGYYSSEDCTWDLPLVNNSKYVLVLYLKEIDIGNYCSGLLWVPGYDGRFCEKHEPYCRIYKTKQNIRCGLPDLYSHLHNISEECNSSNVIITIPELPRQVKFNARWDRHKSFTYQYKFIECPEAASFTTTKTMTMRAIKTTQENRKPTDIMSTEGSTSSYAATTETTSQNNSSPNNEAQEGTHGNEGYNAGIAILCILLVCACAVIAYLIYRQRNMKTRLAQDGSGPEHVAYVNQEAPGNNEYELENVNYQNANLGRPGENEYDVATNPNQHSQEKETVYNELYRM